MRHDRPRMSSPSPSPHTRNALILKHHIYQFNTLYAFPHMGSHHVCSSCFYPILLISCSNLAAHLCCTEFPPSPSGMETVTGSSVTAVSSLLVLTSTTVAAVATWCPCPTSLLLPALLASPALVHAAPGGWGPGLSGHDMHR
jgi:hypothetical protein